MANAVNTMATVTSVQAFGNNNGGTTYRLDVVFKDGMGQEYTSRVSVGKEMQEGEQVEILYDQNNPEKTKPNNKLHIFIIPYALMGSFVPLGIMLVILTMQDIAKVPF